MTVLVTGGAGFIGSHTVDRLLEKGHRVRVLDGLMPPVHEHALPAYVPPDVEFVRGDVRSREAWEEGLKDVEAVFHFAAYQDYLPDYSKFFHINTVGTALLYEIIAEKRLAVRKIVVASSQAVYGEGKYRCAAHSKDDIGEVLHPPPRTDAQLQRGDWEVHCPRCGASMEPLWTDEEVVNPHNQYALSKYTQELIALTLGRRMGIPTVCLRYSIVQGARQSFRNAYSGVLRIFTQRLLHGKPPVCYEDGRQLRDYVSVHDVVNANLLAFESDAVDYQVVNVGGNRRVPVLDYARLIADHAGVAIQPRTPGIYRSGDTRHVFSDVSKLEQLGWRAKVSLEAIVEEYLAWAPAQQGFRDYSSQAEAQMAALGAIRTLHI